MTDRTDDARSSCERGSSRSLMSAPIAGVVEMNVRVGDVVPRGGKLAKLEVMKLEAAVRAPRTVRVIEIHAQSGDTVERGAALVTWEACQ